MTLTMLRRFYNELEGVVHDKEILQAMEAGERLLYRKGIKPALRSDLGPKHIILQTSSLYVTFTHDAASPPLAD